MKKEVIMNTGMMTFAAIIAIFFLIFAWQLFQIAISEQKKTKEWPIFPIIIGIILILLSILSILAATQMR